MRKPIYAVLGLGLGLGGCTETVEGEVTGTQSLAVTLVAPADPGAPDRRLADGARAVTFDVEARDAEGAFDPTFSGELQVFAQFLGTLTPEFGAMPLHDFQITDGRATGISFTLPPTFGPTVLWVDNGRGIGPSYVPGTIAGTATTLWFRDPFVSDLQTPRDETALDALSVSPLQDKQISVGGRPGSAEAAAGSRYGSRGRLVVTSVFAQGYTVSDVQCADDAGTPPCTSQAYDHAMVFTFSAPRDQDGRNVEVGQVLSGFGGGLSEFNGLTEIGFPQTFTARDDGGDRIVDVARLPEPQVVQPSWFGPLSDADGRINFERNEAAPIAIANATVCDLDEDFDTFKQWKLDLSETEAGGDCSRKDNVINVITTGITELDPAALVGKKLPRVVGVLRPVNIGSFNVWIIFPRSLDDVTLN